MLELCERKSTEGIFEPMTPDRMKYNLVHLWGFLLEDIGFNVDWDKLDRAAELLMEVEDAAVHMNLVKEAKPRPDGKGHVGH